MPKIAKYSLSSFISFIVDYSIYSLVTYLTGYIIVAKIIARMIS